MDEFARIDTLCEKIFNGITQLEEYIKEPIAKEALELGKDSNATNNQDMLRGIRKSLSQYKERGKDLVYVGFMGHFSTGKSSTINSLLGLDKDSKTYREIGLNPVDKDITLITHSENSGSIFKITREGLVSIRVSSIDHDFLKNIVLADTPGTGDPEDFKDIAKDFLPICDLILYFFSAANPLDKNDVPLLQEKRHQLEFVPMKYLVTRADEFRIDGNSQLTTENFDKEKAASFKGSLIQRINQVVGTSLSETNSNDIFLIDTKANFNIEELRNFILEFSDTSNSDTQIQIHSHKVDYFRSSSEKIRSFFCEFLSFKLANVSRIVETAKNNIENFHAKIKVTNSELTESWNRKLKDIQNLNTKLNSEVLDYFCKYFTLESIYTESQSIRLFRAELIEEASNIAKLLETNMKLESLSQLESQFQRIRDKINKLSIDNEDIYSNLKLGDFRIEIKESGEEKRSSNFLPSDIVNKGAKRKTQEVHNYLVKEYEYLVDHVERLKDKLDSQVPLKNFHKIIEDAAQSLSSDIDVFFESVKLYRSAVFSLQAKDAITKLGLGQKLDALEAEDLTESEKEVIKRKAQDYIFEKRTEIFEEKLAKFATLQKEIEKLYWELQELRTKKLISDKEIVYHSSEWINESLNDLNQGMIQEIEFYINNELITRINLDLFSRVNEIVSRGKESIKNLRKERNKRLLYIIVSFAVAALIIYWGYVRFTQKSTPSDLFSTVSLGIVVNLASSFVGYVFWKITDNFPSRIQKKEREIINSIGIVCQEVIKENVESFKKEPLEESKFPTLMQDFWQRLLLDEPLRALLKANQEFFTAFKQISSRYSRLQQEYLSLSEDLTNSVSSYFSNPKSNLEKLDKFTSSLKEKSIEPSFKLLNDIEEQLKAVSSKIKEVKFW